MSDAPGLSPTPQTPAPSLFSLHGKNALVTGGSRGIGAAIAIALAQSGARVVIAQRDTTNTETRDAIRSQGGQADLISVNLSDPADAAKVIDRALRVVPRLDVVVNNGGTLTRNDAVDITFEEWNNIINVNLNSLFLICQAAGKHMISRKNGNIINVASLNSFVGGMRVAHYTASKGGVAALTKALSNEWSKYNIRVNAIAPGSTATDINQEARENSDFVSDRLKGIPGGRWGVPADFAGPAVFLASDASSYITGELLTVDGGALAKGPI